jgi:hypothetical protein
MAITERGRWAMEILDERGKKVNGNLTEQGAYVFNFRSTSKCRLSGLNDRYSVGKYKSIY